MLRTQRFTTTEFVPSSAPAYLILDNEIGIQGDLWGGLPGLLRALRVKRALEPISQCRRALLCRTPARVRLLESLAQGSKSGLGCRVSGWITRCGRRGSILGPWPGLRCARCVMLTQWTVPIPSSLHVGSLMCSQASMPPVPIVNQPMQAP